MGHKMIVITCAKGSKVFYAANGWIAPQIMHAANRIQLILHTQVNH